MPFTPVPTTDVEKLMTTLSAKKAEHAKLNKGPSKLLKAGDIKKLDKEIKDLSAKIEQKMEADLKTVRSSFEQHASNVQNLMIQAAKYITTAENAAKAAEKGGTFEKLQAKDISARAADEIQKLVAEAKAQDQDYGKSWFQYRGYNPNTAGLGSEYGKKAADLKSGLMNDGKSVSAKIKSMEAFREKVEAVQAKVENASKKGALDEGEAIAKAKKLADEAAKIAAAIENTKGNNVNVIRNTSNGILGMIADPKPDTARVVRDYITNIVSADKFVRERLKAMEMLVAQVKQAFDAEDLKIKAVADEVDKLNKQQAASKKSYDDELANMKKAIEAGSKFIAGKK